MVRNSVWPGALLALSVGLCALSAGRVCGLEIVTPVKPDAPKPAAAADKPKGPEHNVTLMEEHAVNDLFNKAAKARAKGETDPDAWPDCVKAYADILKKFPNTVYLDKWEGSDKEHPLTAYKNGLYKSTRERVAREIASLPPAAMSVYRVTNEPLAQALYVEGKDQFDERKMEQVARNYFQTSWSNDALTWLGEAAFERGQWRDAAENYRNALANPGKAATPMSVRVRLLLTQTHSGDKAGAVKTLAEIETAMKDPRQGALRVGSDEGDAGLAKLKARVDAMPAVAQAENADAGADWTTYLGNAAHNQAAQSRMGRGLRKWSVRIDDLLYGKNATSPDLDRSIADDGTDASINHQLTIKDGYFFINDAQVYAAYPMTVPEPGARSSGGNAKFQLPAENVKNPPKKKAASNARNINTGEFVAPMVVQHPYFATLAGERAFGVLGAESYVQGVIQTRWGIVRRFNNGGEEEKPKGPSNYLVCFGRAENAHETTQLWSLKPGDAAFNAQSKADQEWLKGAYFASSPTYDSGVLYAMAVVIPGALDGAAAPLDAWAVAADAESGRLLWRTQICTANAMRYPGTVQPDRGLPVAVDNRTVYVVTNLGAVAALDTGGGSVKWIRVYDRAKTMPDQMWGQGEIAMSHEFWAPNPPIVYKNRLIVAPQDSDMIYGYDIETGARVWEKSRLGEPDGADSTDKTNAAAAPPSASRYKHLLGISNGALVMTGTDVLFVSALSGKYLTEPIPVDGTIKGRGAVTGNAAWISTDRELLRIDITTAVTVTTAAPHDLKEGQKVTLSGVDVARYNGEVTVQFVPAVPKPTKFTYVLPPGELRSSTNGGSVSVAGGAPVAIQSVSASTRIEAPVPFKWADPKAEAGSVYSAGGVLYTVSHSHVNAYIVWEELESKILARLKTNPDDFAARVELADVYKSIERFDQAMAELEKARQSAEKSNDGKAPEALASIGGRKFETLMALGEKARQAKKMDEAAGYLNRAYETAMAPGMAEVLPVLALKAEAEMYESAGNLTGAAQAYQKMIAKHGNAVFQDQPQSSRMARLYAQSRIAELKAKDPSSVAPIDAEAKAALAAAGSDAVKLENVVTQFPNSEHAGAALLALARTDLEKAPDRSRLNAMRYMSRQRGGAETALALVLEAAACERLNLLALARDALVRLASSDDYKEAKVSFKGIDPNAAAEEMSARDWAAKRLEEAQFKRAPSNAMFAFGKGLLHRDPVWTKPNGENTLVLLPDGIPPVEMRRAVFYIENSNEISCISGRDGLELWKPRPTAPPNSHGRAFWWERLLIVCGDKTITAYDSSESGKIAWMTDLKLDKAAEQGYWCQISGDRIVVAHSNNTLQGYDAASGAPLWRTTLAGSQMSFPPACGDGFLAVATANSNKLTAYNLETGSAMWTADVAELRAPPVVAGDRVYVAQRTPKLSVFEGKTGKRACPDIPMESAAIGLRAAGELAIASQENRDIVAFRADPKNPGKAWQVLLPVGGRVTDFFVDGDDLLVATELPPMGNAAAKNELAAFSIKSQGKIKWKQDMAAEAAAQLMSGTQRNNLQGQRQAVANFGGNIVIRGGGRVIIQNGQVLQLDDPFNEGAGNFVNGGDGSGGWLRENVAREGIVMMQSVWEVNGAQSKVATEIDRTTGKSVWDAPLKAEGVSDGSGSKIRVQLFDGGLVLFDARGRSGYVVPRGGGSEEEVKDLTALAAKDPADVDVRIKLASAKFEKGEGEKALSDLMLILSDAKTSDAGFAAAYTQFAFLRKVLAAQQHAKLSFQRVDKAPDLAGGAAGWEGVAESNFDGWRDVYLASEDVTARVQPKKDLWRGPDDLKASFKGAYDDARLYIQITVKDDVHKNEQAEGGRIDFGDAVTLAFDIGLSGGVSGYGPETFELALGLAKTGKAAGWRRRENGRYLRGQTPLEKDFSVTRKEGEHVTLYQLALPLEYLGLKPEAGKKFGFTFAVQDQDNGSAIEKSLCSSPGLIGTREPRCFSQGVLEAKK